MAGGKSGAYEEGGKIVGGLLRSIFGFGAKKEAKDVLGAVSRRTAPQTIAAIRSGGRSNVSRIRNLLESTTPERLQAMRESTARVVANPAGGLPRYAAGTVLGETKVGGRTLSKEAAAAWKKELDDLAELEKSIASPEAIALKRLNELPDEQLTYAERRLKYALEKGKPLTTGERFQDFMVNMSKAPLRTAGKTAAKYGGLGVAAGLGLYTPYALYRGFQGGGTGGLELDQATLDALRTTTGTTAQADPYQQMIDLINASYAQGDGMSAKAQANLQDYLNNLNAYAAAQGPAVRKAYEDLATQAAQEAAAAYASGQGAAANLDMLYQQAADTAAGYGAGEGLASAPSDVTGLTGVSGEMATAPQETAAYGKSLADYMGRTAGITRDDLAAAARSYQAAGIGSEAELRNLAALLGSQRQFEVGNKIAEYEAAREADRQNAVLQAALGRIEYNAQMNPQLTSEQTLANQLEARNLLESMTEEERAKVLSVFNGSVAEFIASYTRDPQSVTAVVATLTGQ